MKEYLSPGVYPQEYDRSFLQQAPSAGAAATFIGTFTKGRAFIPMLIKDTNDLIDKTGEPNGINFTQYAAYEYSKQKGEFWVQRLLWQQGWTTDAYAVYASKTVGENTTGEVLAILLPTTTNVAIKEGTVTSASKTGTVWTNLECTFEQGNIQTSYDLTIEQILNIDQSITNNPQTTAPIYLFGRTNDLKVKTDLNDYDTISIEKITDFIKDTEAIYSSARTPMIKNEFNQDLFYFNHLGDGTYTNKDVKISIEGVKTEKVQWTEFNVVVRKYDDTDKKPIILETYYKLNLNPLSQNFIGKRIGDVYSEYDEATSKIKLHGDFKNVSKYIRVVVSDGVKNSTIAKLGNVYTVQHVPFVSKANSITNEYPTLITGEPEVPNTYQGYDTNKFAIRYLSNPTFGTEPSTSTTFTDKYTIVFYGGFDGIDPANKNISDENTLLGFDVTNEQSYGYASYKKALDIIKQPDEYDIDLISMPGINLQDIGKKQIFEYALQIAQNRGDCTVIGDAANELQSNVATVINATQDFDSSYGAVYYPSVKIQCPFTKTFPIVPASTYIPAVIAYTANVSEPHFAPAGINRGTLDVLQAYIKLNRSDRDKLYENRINPIASFANSGTVVWGQKTLQKKPSALDRLNVRILLNNIKKWVQDYGRTVLFNNNTTTLRSLFTMGVQKYLNGIVSADGLYAYKFKMDQTNNTPDVIDRNQLVGELWLKPTKTAQYIILPINIVRSDAEL